MLRYHNEASKVLVGLPQKPSVSDINGKYAWSPASCVTRQMISYRQVTMPLCGGLVKYERMPLLATEVLSI